MKNFTPKKKFATARLMVREKAPYVTAALLGLIPREIADDERCPTMGVTNNGYLLWNPNFVEKLNLEEIAAVLYHEVWHFLRDHGARRIAMGAEPKLFNIAADAEINDDLKKPKWQLPAGGIYPSSIGCEEGLTAEGYYAKIREDVNDAVKEILAREPGWGDGRCGSAGGNPLPNEPGESGNDSAKNEGEKEKDKKKDKGEGGGDGSGDDSDGSSMGKGRTQAEMSRMRRQVAREIQDTMENSKGRGDMPGGMARWAEASLEPAKVRWQDKLRVLCRNAMTYRPGAVDFTYTKPSRRQYGVGFGVGKPILPSMRQPVPNICVAVDTSGSMGQEELNDALREIKGILVGAKADVTFTSCDAAVHSTKKIKTWKDAACEMKGGGGTSFVPVFEHLPNIKPQPEVLVFITDGGGPAPAIPPVGVNTIWLLVGSHAMVPWAEGGSYNGSINWGEFIWMDDEAAKRQVSNDDDEDDGY
jgi:predicted metal-dependent peptidase